MDERILAKEYNPHPMESETKESETDEGRDLEYFHVPADNRDNRTAAADYLVDFKTVSFFQSFSFHLVLLSLKKAIIRYVYFLFVWLLDKLTTWLVFYDAL